MAFLEYAPTRTLYQYCSVEGFLGLAKTKSLWLSDLSAANDPREIKFGFDKFIDALKSVRDNEYNGERADLLTTLATDLTRHRSSSQAFCACFSLIADELPMWREYGSNYSGLAIGFRPTAITSMAGRIQLVNYLGRDSVDGFLEVARRIASEIGPSLESQIAAASDALAVMTATKHSSWSYEKEVRLVCSQPRRGEPRIPTTILEDGTRVDWMQPLKRVRANETIEYIAYPFGIRRDQKPDSRKAIKEVIAGPNCTLSGAAIDSTLRENGFVDFEVKKSDCLIR
jgi:hypothetical protein